MASTSTESLRKKIYGVNWQESYAGIILGAIVVVVIGLLVANYFVKSRGQIGTAETASQSQEETKPETYKVVAGDSLSLIANKVYGSYDYWPVLAKVNNIANPNIISTNQELQLPQKAQADTIKEEMSATTYQVQAGDTLFIVAQKMYGDGSKWVLIDRANHIGRLPNGNPLIFSDNTLTIPR